LSQRWRWNNWEPEWITWLKDPFYSQESGYTLGDLEKLEAAQSCDGPDEVHFTRYAIHLMERRGISEVMVYEALRKPDEIRIDVVKKFMIALKRVGDKTLIVLFNIGEHGICKVKEVLSVMMIPTPVSIAKLEIGRWKTVKIA